MVADFVLVINLLKYLLKVKTKTYTFLRLVLAIEQTLEHAQIWLKSIKFAFIYKMQIFHFYKFANISQQN